jgi:hypothetical protein
VSHKEGTTMKKMLVAALILPVALLGAARPAKASDKAAAIFAGVAAGIGAALIFDALIPHPVVAAPAPVVVQAPPPVVYQPAPVVVQVPPPIVYQPAPVVVQAPPPVIVTPPPVIYQAPAVYAPVHVVAKHPRRVVYAHPPVYVRDRHSRVQWVPVEPRYIHDQ